MFTFTDKFNEIESKWMDLQALVSQYSNPPSKTNYWKFLNIQGLKILKNCLKKFELTLNIIKIISLTFDIQSEEGTGNWEEHDEWYLHLLNLLNWLDTEIISINFTLSVSNRHYCSACYLSFYVSPKQHHLYAYCPEYHTCQLFRNTISPAHYKTNNSQINFTKCCNKSYYDLMENAMNDIEMNDDSIEIYNTETNDCWYSFSDRKSPKIINYVM